MNSERGYVMTRRARATAETGERILDATEQLFAEVPYAQLTLRAVADRAGVTVQTVIRRFGDKEGLITATAARASSAIFAQRDAAPAGELVAAVDNLVTHYEESGRTALRLLDEESAVPQLAVLTEAGRAYHRQWCGRVFADALAPLRGTERARRLAQLVAVCDVYTWKLLRLDAGLSQRQTALAITELIEPLITRTTKGQ